MANPQQRPARYEDLFGLADNLVGEIVGGELFTHPRPGPKHARTSSALGIKIGGPFDQGEHDGPGDWWILDEPEVHLGSDVVVPDLAGWRRSRLPAMPDTAWIELEPDWVCEVLSPSTARIDRMVKMPLYAANAVPYCWLVDPTAKTLEAFRLTDGNWLLLASFVDDTQVAIEPFAAMPFSLGALWSE